MFIICQTKVPGRKQNRRKINNVAWKRKRMFLPSRLSNFFVSVLPREQISNCCCLLSVSLLMPQYGFQMKWGWSQWGTDLNSQKVQFPQAGFPLGAERKITSEGHMGWKELHSLTLQWRSNKLVCHMKGGSLSALHYISLKSRAHRKPMILQDVGTGDLRKEVVTAFSKSKVISCQKLLFIPCIVQLGKFWPVHNNFWESGLSTVWYALSL